MKPCTIDRYLLGLMVGPMAAVLSSTMFVFLMERILRSLDQLSQTENGFGFLMKLMVDLTPHYIGLTAPAAFFVALFVVVTRVNANAEIDAMLASGMSMDRITRPFVWLGLAMTLLSLTLYGFIQPYSRYAYREVLHAVAAAGWNGAVRPRGILAPNPDFLLTADTVSRGGKLTGVFLRLQKDGVEDVLTAQTAELRRRPDGKSVILDLHDGQQVSTTARGFDHMLTFTKFTLELPVAPAARLLRSRGDGQETEWTLSELVAAGLGARPPALPRQLLLGELYSRLARAVAFALMPFLAVPLGITAKRSGSSAAMAVAGLLLFGFQTALILGQGLASKALAPAALALGLPLAVFAGCCVAAYGSSRSFPGDNVVNRLTGVVSDLFDYLGALVRRLRGEDRWRLAGEQ